MRVRIGIFAAALALAASPLCAQAVPDSSAFLKAVREADGAKAMSLLDGPGSTVANARDSGTGETALHITIKRRDLVWTQFMAQHHVNPNLTDKAGDTPLGLAARIGFLEGAQTLVANGAKIDGVNARGETPLIIAVQGHRLDMVQMLVRNGANPDKTDSSAGYSARDYARQDRRSAAILRALDARSAPAPARAAAPRTGQ